MRSGRELVVLLLVVFAVGSLGGLAAAHFHVPDPMGKWVVGGVAGAVYLVVMIRQDRARTAAGARAVPRPREPYVSPYAVSFDDTEVVVTEDGAPSARVAWADLLTVGVRIDEAFLPQPWWLLFSRTGQLAAYPGEARGAMEMLAELQRRLPDFDNFAVARVMGMMEGGVVVWERK